MSNKVTLREMNIEIIGGQIMSRVTAKAENGEQAVVTRKVIIPKGILSSGVVDVSVLPEEGLKVDVDEKRITKVGDIVIKLSPPFDAAIIDEASADCVVPSFCAIIKPTETIVADYLLAFLNSSYCKEQLKQQVAGSVMTVLSVGKVANVYIPLAERHKQEEIGHSYRKTQHKLNIINQIIELEAKRNDVIFKEMVNDND